MKNKNYNQLLFLVTLILFCTAACKKPLSNQHLFPIAIKSKMGFIDSTGTIKIKPDYDYVGSFCEGKAVAVIDSLYGYIDEQGKWIIKPKFSVIPFILDGVNNTRVFLTFDEGLKRDSIYKNFKAHLTSNGDTIYHYNLPFQINFHQGLAIYCGGHHYGYIDSKGDVVIKPQFMTAEDFSEGLAAVSINIGSNENSSIKYGYINLSGKWMIKPTYDHALSFSEGKASVMVMYQISADKGSNKEGNKPQLPFNDIQKMQWTNAKTMVINHKEQMLFVKDVQYISEFTNGYAVCYDQGREMLYGQGYNYIDSTGKMVVDYSKGAFKKAKDVSMIHHWGETDSTAGTEYTLLLVKSNISTGIAKWGYISPDLTSPFGKTPVEILKYDNAFPFSEGLARVKIDGKWGFINPAGKLVIPANFSYAQDFDHGLAHVVQKEGTFKLSGYVNKEGIMIWHTQ